MNEKEMRVEKEWTDNKGNKLIIGSVEGKWHKILNTKKQDRLYFIMINENQERFYIKHEQQMDLMEFILNNDILQRTFLNNCRKFEDRINKIKGEWKNE